MALDLADRIVLEARAQGRCSSCLERVPELELEQHHAAGCETVPEHEAAATLGLTLPL